LQGLFDVRETYPGEKHVDLKFPVPYEMNAAKDTHYECHIAELPTVASKSHIVEFEMVVDPRNVGRVHHMLMFDCTAEVEEYLTEQGVSSVEELGERQTGDCRSGMYATRAIRSCNGDKLMSMWGVGGGNHTLPADVGLPFGGPDEPRYVLIEYHYDNPGASTWEDDSGVRIHYTEQLLQYDGGIMSTGVETLPGGAVIPADQKTWEWTGYCPPECLASRMTQNVWLAGITLHTHTYGYYVSTTLIRDGKEIAIVGEDQYYDFDLQVNRKLTTEIEMRPTDTLYTTCRYKTEGREGGPVAMGLATKDEMCLSYITYYPRIEKLDNCKQMPGSMFKETAQVRCDGISSRGSTYTFQKPTYEPLQDKSCDRYCGDGIVNGDEMCDDGNTVDGDGCNKHCTPENGYDCETDSDGKSMCSEADVDTGGAGCDITAVLAAQTSIPAACGWGKDRARSCDTECIDFMHMMVACVYDSTVRSVAGSDMSSGLLGYLSRTIGSNINEMPVEQCGAEFTGWDTQCEGVYTTDRECYGTKVDDTPRSPHVHSMGTLSVDDVRMLDSLESTNYPNVLELPKDKYFGAEIHWMIDHQRDGAHVHLKISGGLMWWGQYIGVAIGDRLIVGTLRQDGEAFAPLTYKAESPSAFSTVEGFDASSNVDGDAFTYAYAQHLGASSVDLSMHASFPLLGETPESMTFTVMKGMTENKDHPSAGSLVAPVVHETFTVDSGYEESLPVVATKCKDIEKKKNCGGECRWMKGRCMTLAAHAKETKKLTKKLKKQCKKAKKGKKGCKKASKACSYSKKKKVCSYEE